MSFAHLRDLARTDGANEFKTLSKALAQFADLVATGGLPASLSTWLAAAPLSPLRKRNDGVRPIAVGETLRRLVGKLLMRPVRDRAAALLRPTQLRVGVPCGIGAIVHSIRHQTAKHRDDSRVALLSLDFRNAFNLVSRHAIRRSLRSHFPELLAYFEACYMGEAPLLWSGDLRLHRVQGCQQGDPLGPLLFRHRATRSPRLFAGFLGGPLDDALIPELRLPVRSSRPSLGLGLTSAVAISAAAYLASVVGSIWLLPSITPDTPEAEFLNQPRLLAAHQLWCGQVLADDVLDFASVVRRDGPKQRELAQRVHKKALGDVPETDLRQTAHRASLGVDGVKTG